MNDEAFSRHDAFASPSNTSIRVVNNKMCHGYQHCWSSFSYAQSKFLNQYGTLPYYPPARYLASIGFSKTSEINFNEDNATYFLQKRNTASILINAATHIDDSFYDKRNSGTKADLTSQPKIDKQTQTDIEPATSNTTETVVSFNQKQLFLNERYNQLEKELSYCPPGPEIDFAKLNLSGPLSNAKIERSNQMNDILHVLKVKQYWSGKSKHTTNVFKSRQKKITKDNNYLEIFTVDLSRHKTHEKKAPLNPLRSQF